MENQANNQIINMVNAIVKFNKFKFPKDEDFSKFRGLCRKEINNSPICKANLEQSALAFLNLTGSPLN